MKNIDYILADPAGNRTILVLTPVPRSDYQEVARALLDHCPEAEQVGYVLSHGRKGNSGEWDELPRMDMCGLEFCGNATRAFAFYEAERAEPPADRISVLVSGCDHPLTAEIDREGDTVRIGMPGPRGMEHVIIPAGGGDGPIEGDMVWMDGISHLVLAGVEADRDRFLRIRDWVYERFAADPADEADRLAAFGVMFLDGDPGRGEGTPAGALRMTPVVYVRDVDTVYFEGSCASGSTAAAYALAMNDERETLKETYVLRQPEGTLEVRPDKADGRMDGILLQGPVRLSQVRTMSFGG